MQRIFSRLWSKEAWNDAPQYLPCQPEKGSCICTLSQRGKIPYWQE